jgi:hypothetical protein
MTDNPVHRDDITALRKEDDLKSYMRSLIRPTETPTTTTPKRRRYRHESGHQPGAWPTGTSPPGPPTDWDHPPEAWADAVHRYRTEQRHKIDEENQ